MSNRTFFPTVFLILQTCWTSTASADFSGKLIDLVVDIHQCVTYLRHDYPFLQKELSASLKKQTGVTDSDLEKIFFKPKAQSEVEKTGQVQLQYALAGRLLKTRPDFVSQEELYKSFKSYVHSGAIYLTTLSDWQKEPFLEVLVQEILEGRDYRVLNLGKALTHSEYAVTSGAYFRDAVWVQTFLLLVTGIDSTIDPKLMERLARMDIRAHVQGMSTQDFTNGFKLNLDVYANKAHLDPKALAKADIDQVFMHYSELLRRVYLKTIPMEEFLEMNSRALNVFKAWDKSLDAVLPENIVTANIFYKKMLIRSFAVKQLLSVSQYLPEHLQRRE